MLFDIHFIEHYSIYTVTYSRKIKLTFLLFITILRYFILDPTISMILTVLSTVILMSPQVSYIKGTYKLTLSIGNAEKKRKVYDENISLERNRIV